MFSSGNSKSAYLSSVISHKSLSSFKSITLFNASNVKAYVKAPQINPVWSPLIKSKLSFLICSKALLIKDNSTNNDLDLPWSIENTLIASRNGKLSISPTVPPISKITKYGFEVWIIPHTYKLTNLSKLKINSLVNIEIDILSKYVKKYFNEK